MAGDDARGGLRPHLADAKPDVLEQIESEAGSGLDKAAHNREARHVQQLLTTEDPIVKSPRQAPELVGDDTPVDVVVHMGCHAIRTPHIVDATLDLLDVLGYTAVPLGGFSNCCGILDIGEGDLETADAVDTNRFENAAAFDPDVFVTECTSCHATTETVSMGYRDPGFELRSMTELLLERLDDLLEHVERTDPVTVTLHDHHGSYGWMPPEQHDYARDLFGSLPGVDVVEMEHSREDYLPCNFGQDPDELGHDDLSRDVWREAEDAGADVLINFWHACDRELAWYEPDFPLVTTNYVTFVAERLGIEHENRTKRYKILGREGRLDELLTAAQDTYLANGLTDAEAWELAEAVFTPEPGRVLG